MEIPNVSILHYIDIGPEDEVQIASYVDRIIARDRSGLGPGRHDEGARAWDRAWTRGYLKAISAASALAAEESVDVAITHEGCILSVIRFSAHGPPYDVVRVVPRPYP